MKTRLIILTFISLSFSTVYSQARIGEEHIRVMDGFSKKRWQTSTFSEFTFNNGWFNRGSFTALSAPVGVQLTRQLNKNLYAFGQLSAAPVFFTFNTAFSNPAANKAYPGNTLFNQNHFGINPRAEAGLFYINDQKTFSLSGSISIDRGTNLFYPSYRFGNSPVRPLR